MVSFTKVAENKILETLRSPNLPEGYAVRVGMKGGACSGSYLFGLDKPTENDEQYKMGEIIVLIDKRHLMYVIGLQIDFEEGGYTLKK